MPNMATTICNLVKREVENKRAPELAKKTGLHINWFYQIARGSNKNPKCDAASKFLSAINHPIMNEVKKAA